MPTKMTVRCTEQEYETIQKKADELGMALSEYVRFVALHAKVEVLVPRGHGAQSKNTKKRRD